VINPLFNYRIDASGAVHCQSGDGTYLRTAHMVIDGVQRARGLFFLSIGAAVASSLESEAFHIYETGIGCLNVPTSSAQIASQGTRAMHPRTLSLFNQLVKRVLDRSPRVVAPFFFLTKGELCGLVRDDLNALAKFCSSCDEGDGHKADPMQHCGLCTSCIFRRLSIAASGISDPTKYRDTPSRRHNCYELSAFEHHADKLARISTFEDLTDLDPNVRFASEAPSGTKIEPVMARSQVVEMYRRYGAQVSSYLTSARPSLRPRPERPAKEMNRDLFAAAR
jgi:queuosine biosynthesis protein QueC